MLTILIPTSPIPSHPSTRILDETIANLRRYSAAEIIIMADGIHPSLSHRTADYYQYLFDVEENIKADKYGNCSIYRFIDHTHQAEMTKQVIKNLVRTPVIFFCEHDTYPTGEIPWDVMIKTVATYNFINYIRLNIFSQIPEEHKYLMIERSVTIRRMYLQRTIQWSQRPHFAKTKWYLNLLEEYFNPGEKMMIEDRMHGIVQYMFSQRRPDPFGLYIYTPEGDQLRSLHLDGRESDIKIIEA